MTKKELAIADRFGALNKPNKMKERVSQSVDGQLTSFSGIFNITELSALESERLKTLLKDYATSTEPVDQDLQVLIGLTSEVKAISNQAAILHGERIKKAQALFARYSEGAFSEWLVAAYGNRQTPYNFLQYYEFYTALSKELQAKVDSMPRQAIYTLASRKGDEKLKIEILESYQGETKTALLEKIREQLPLAKSDKRARSTGDSLIVLLASINKTVQRKRLALTKKQKDTITELIHQIRGGIDEANHL